jgi:bleomycin hydrolase
MTINNLKKQNKKINKKDNLNLFKNIILNSSINEFKNKFVKNNYKQVVQNVLCSNYLESVIEVRNYIQSRDTNFSHTIEPKLNITNQGLTGRCWMFSVLNVLRYEIIRDMQLSLDFEFSESYLTFYEKLEKCNYFLSQFTNLKNINLNNDNVKKILTSGMDEGGYWLTCVNLIKKYGLVPKSCFLESINSYNTYYINNLINKKLREFALVLINTKPIDRLNLKLQMIEEIYNILSKMLGTPPCPNEEFEWSYTPKIDMIEILEIDKNRKNTKKYKTLENKRIIKTTPINFYEKFVSKKFNDYYEFGNDPRNLYNKYYESYKNTDMVEGEINGFYNVKMEILEKICIKSILNNTPIMFCCDVNQYLNDKELLFDKKCFNYDLIFDTEFDKLTKKENLNVFASCANHAMVIVGVDLDESGYPLKWKIENSWGFENQNDGFYTMSHDWFKDYVYNVIIYKDFLTTKTITEYVNAKNNPTKLLEDDIMS